MDRNMQGPTGAEKAAGLVFALLVFGLVAYTIVYEVDLAGSKGQMMFVLVAVAVGAIFAVVPGFLNFSYNRAGVVVRAAGGAAAFAGVLYLGQSWAQAERPAPAPAPVQVETGLVETARAPAPGPAPAPAADPVAGWFDEVLAGYRAGLAEAMAAPTLYHATSYCPITGASGWATHSDPILARTYAIANCVGYGGIYDCCDANVAVAP